MRGFSDNEEVAYYYSLEQEEREWIQEISFVNGTFINTILNLVLGFGYCVGEEEFGAVSNIIRGRELNDKYR